MGILVRSVRRRRHLPSPFAPEVDDSICVEDVAAARVELEAKGVAFVGETLDTGFLDRQVVTCVSFTMVDIFDAISTRARRAILDELVERDGQTLFELCTRLTMRHGLGLTRQAISQHLDVLESAGLVTSERQGRYKLHYLNADPLETIVERWVKPRRKGAKR